MDFFKEHIETFYLVDGIPLLLTHIRPKNALSKSEGLFLLLKKASG